MELQYGNLMNLNTEILPDQEEPVRADDVPKPKKKDSKKQDERPLYN